jgi:hypothetical protein
MAGVLIPTWVLLVFLALSISGALPDVLERALIFPMAVVPNLWGAWNTLYLALSPRRISLGVFGAVLPLILMPAGYWLATRLNLRDYVSLYAVALLPVGMVVYYLVWKHGVGFFNRVVGLGDAYQRRP